MKTTATNRRIRELLTQIKRGTLIPRPEFQRRLVWSNKDKSAFLETVLLNYPFPEVYVAAGDVDVETGEATEMLVDGQQRITTLYQYFTGSPDIKLNKAVRGYAELGAREKEDFLQYEVVIRDLGKVELDQIREVFKRINATRYALNAMEIHNARFEGELKICAEEISRRPFFEQHHVFSATDIRRMQDTRFVLTVIATLQSTYFNRDDELEDWLKRYNDEFPQSEDVKREMDALFSFIVDMQLPASSRAWKRADLFTLLVEVHRCMFRDKLSLEPKPTAERLAIFYQKVDDFTGGTEADKDVAEYYKAALQATNDRGSRITRGNTLHAVLLGSNQTSLPIFV